MTESDILFFLKNFDLANTLLLGLEGINEEILEMLACLPLNMLFRIIFLTGVLLNCAETYCLKDLLSLLAVNLSQLYS